MIAARKILFTPMAKRIPLSKLAEDNGYVRVNLGRTSIKQIVFIKGEQEIVVCNTCGGSGYVAVKQPDGKYKRYFKEDAVNFLKQPNEKVEKEEEKIKVD